MCAVEASVYLFLFIAVKLNWRFAFQTISCNGSALILEIQQGRVDSQVEVLNRNQLSETSLIKIADMIVPEMRKANFDASPVVVFKHVLEYGQGTTPSSHQQSSIIPFLSDEILLCINRVNVSRINDQAGDILHVG